MDAKKIAGIVEATEKFHFSYSVISKKQANKTEKLYGFFAEEFENNKHDIDKIENIYNDFIKKLEVLFPKEAEFLENFAELSYKKKKKVIYYVFYKIHEKESQGATILNFENNQANLEHINSQKGSKLDENLLHSIGNLIPLSQVNNSKAGNKTLQEKIQSYKNSGSSIPIINEVIEKLEENKYEWGEEDIKIWTINSLGEKMVWPNKRPKKPSEKILKNF